MLVCLRKFCARFVCIAGHRVHLYFSLLLTPKNTCFLFVLCVCVCVFLYVCEKDI